MIGRRFANLLVMLCALTLSKRPCRLSRLVKASSGMFILAMIVRCEVVDSSRRDRGDLWDRIGGQLVSQ